MTAATQVPPDRLASAFTPHWPTGGYIPHTPWPKQRVFLCLDHILDVGYGGAAGPGKSDALLMAALQYVDVPGYKALLIRRTINDLEQEGALIDRSSDWLKHTDAEWNDNKKRWTFPTGAHLRFGYLSHDRRMEELFDSSEYHFIGIDEATQMTRRQFKYMFSRLRVTKELQALGLRPRFRSASNPGGVGHDFYAHRYRLGEYADLPMPPDRAFVPGRLEDNPALIPDDYERALINLDPLDYQRKREGNWLARERGTWFDRDRFTVIPAADVPDLVRIVRHWDWAATDEAEAKTRNIDPDWTVGVKAGLDAAGSLYIIDVARFRANPAETDRRVRTVAQHDGLNVVQSVEQEPGASGKRDISHIRRTVLAGHTIHVQPARQNKKTRAKPVSSLIMSDEPVYVTAAGWNNTFFGEVEAFPTPGVHDDQVDGLSGAYQYLTGRKGWGSA